MPFVVEVGGVWTDPSVRKEGDETSNALVPTTGKTWREPSRCKVFGEAEKENSVSVGISKMGVCGERSVEAFAGTGGEAVCTRVDAAGA